MVLNLGCTLERPKVLKTCWRSTLRDSDLTDLGSDLCIGTFQGSPRDSNTVLRSLGLDQRLANIFCKTSGIRNLGLCRPCSLSQLLNFALGSTKATTDDMQTNEHDYILIKLYSQQTAWPGHCLRL